MSERSSENPSEPMARAAAGLRSGCFISAIAPADTIGAAGISHRICAIGEAANCELNEADS